MPSVTSALAALYFLLLGVPLMSNPASSSMIFQNGEMVELSFQLSGIVGNPFMAPVWVSISDPAGGELYLPAFHDGENIWRVRHTPLQQGNYTVAGVLLGESPTDSDLVQVLDSSAGDFMVEGPPSNGFLRRSPHYTQRFQYDIGTPYFPIGFNVGWAAPADYPVIFDRMSRAGLNWSRVWMNHWASMTLDWVMGKELEPGDLDLDVARKWDGIVEAAEQHNIAFQLVLQSHGQFSTTVNPVWQEHPWNVGNGGWLEHPGDFFTDPKARKLTKAKYRYIVARWGYSTSIMAWELFNEVEFTDGYIGRDLLAIRNNIETQGIFNLESGRRIADLYARLEKESPGEAKLRMEQFGTNLKHMLAGEQQQIDYGLGRHIVANWHREMAAHIRAIDPYDHLITTSSLPVDSSTWDAMDYYQGHVYRREMIMPLAKLPRAHDWFDKPYFVAEMGDHSMIDPAKGDGRHMHGMLWAGLFSGGAGAAQVWAWDRIEAWDFYRKFEILTGFADRGRIAHSEFLPIDATFHPAPAPVGKSVKPAVFAITSPETTLLWVCDLNGLSSPQPFPISGHLEIPALAAHDSTIIEWTNTRSGERHTTPSSKPGINRGIRVPEFHGDVAAIIHHTRQNENRSQ